MSRICGIAIREDDAVVLLAHPLLPRSDRANGPQSHYRLHKILSRPPLPFLGVFSQLQILLR